MLKFYLIASTILFFISVVDLILNDDRASIGVKLVRALLFVPMTVIGSILIYNTAMT
jgi:hypothetical protein